MANVEAKVSRSVALLPFENAEAPVATGIGLPESFRRLYFHLYSNSRATRAERIIEDLSLLLLAKLAGEGDGARHLEAVRSGQASANEQLLPYLRAAYPNLVDDAQRFSIGDDAVLVALKELDGVSLSNAPAQVIGEAFQALIGPRLRGDKGQFFTPRSLVRAMVQVLAPQPNEAVLDPACGTGGFLMEAYLYQQTQSSSKGVSATGRLVGVDKDHDLFRLASALLQVASRGKAEVFNFDSLCFEKWNAIGSDSSASLFDVIVTNPPFGAKIGIRDQDVLKSYALGYQWALDESEEWVQTPLTVGAQDPQVLFVEACVRHLVPGGRLGIVLPEGLFGNRRDTYIWQWLATQGRILALLDCPRTTFQPGTDTKTNVLFFQKSDVASPPKPKAKRLSVRIAVAMHCGHDRRGRTQFGDGRPCPDDFPEIGLRFNHNGVGPWRSVRVDPTGYLVPRYYSEEKPATSLEAELTSGATWISLGELVANGRLTVRKGNEVGSDAYGSGDIPFVRTSDISNLEISTDPTKAISEELYEEFARQQALRPGDLLMVVDGRYRIGATAMLTARNVKCVVQSHIRILSVHGPDAPDSYELLFALNLPSVRLRIRDLVFVQSTLGTLGKRLFELRVPLANRASIWKERIDQFRRILVERDRLLGELRGWQEGDYEL